MEEVVFPIICFLGVVGILLLIGIPIGIRKRPLWRRQGRCASCGYDMMRPPRGALCPECGRDPFEKPASQRWHMTTQQKNATFVPLVAALLMVLSMAPYGLPEMLIGLHGLVPLSVLAMILMQLERRVSPAAMAGFAVGSTLPAAATILWVAHMLIHSTDGQAALSLFFSWGLALGAAGLGLPLGYLVERWTT